jgi:2-iminobutanoate/2-iminopropanoate deaminase
VRKQKHHCENNALAEVSVQGESAGGRQGRLLTLARFSKIARLDDELPGQPTLADADKAWDARAISGSTILTLSPSTEKELAMSKTAVTSPELTPPVGPFSQAIEVGGFLYFSGQVGQDPATGKVVEGGIVAETECVFRNLAAILKAAGRSFDDVARAGVYLTNISDFAAMNVIYARHFSQPFPARTTIGVAALPLGACVEIDLVVKA